MFFTAVFFIKLQGQVWQSEHCIKTALQGLYLPVNMVQTVLVFMVVMVVMVVPMMVIMVMVMVIMVIMVPAPQLAAPPRP